MLNRFSDKAYTRQLRREAKSDLSDARVPILCRQVGNQIRLENTQASGGFRHRYLIESETEKNVERRYSRQTGNQVKMVSLT